MVFFFLRFILKLPFDSVSQRAHSRKKMKLLQVLVTAAFIVLINAAAYIADKGVLTVLDPHQSGTGIHTRILEHVSVRLDRARRFNMINGLP